MLKIEMVRFGRFIAARQTLLCQFTAVRTQGAIQGAHDFLYPEEAIESDIVGLGRRSPPPVMRL
jgi:hypothetical protein